MNIYQYKNISKKYFEKTFGDLDFLEPHRKEKWTKDSGLPANQLS